MYLHSMHYIIAFGLSPLIDLKFGPLREKVRAPLV